MGEMEISMGQFVAGVLVSNAAGIGAKIIWDWLKGKKDMRGAVETHVHAASCPMHSEVMDAAKAASRCITELRDRTTALEVLLKSHTDRIKEDLTDGKKKFTELETRINTMQQQVIAHLVQWSAQVDELKGYFK